MSRVISSGPSLVSRASTSCSWMWIDVSTSSFTRRSREDDGVLEVVALPRHEGDEQVLAERQLAVVGRGTVGEDRRPCTTLSPSLTSGCWLMQVSWFDRAELAAAGRPCGRSRLVRRP